MLTDRSFFVYTATQTTSDAVFSHAPHHLPSSLTYNFNVSIRRVKEDVRYAYVRIPKLSLPLKTFERVKEQCNGPISLQLLVRVHSNETDSTPRNVFTLLSSARLTHHNISRSLQVEFSDITQPFKQWQKESRHSDIVEMRLIIGGSGSCYNTLTPEDLGFRANTSAYIVVFSKSDDSQEALIKAGLTELAAEATASRQRRNAVDGANTETDTPRVTGGNNNTHSQEFNSTIYHLLSCRRYSHTVRHTTLTSTLYISHICIPVAMKAQHCKRGK